MKSKTQNKLDKYYPFLACALCTILWFLGVVTSHYSKAIINHETVLPKYVFNVYSWTVFWIAILIFFIYAAFLDKNNKVVTFFNLNINEEEQFNIKHFSEFISAQATVSFLVTLATKLMNSVSELSQAIIYAILFVIIISIMTIISVSSMLNILLVFKNSNLKSLIAFVFVILTAMSLFMAGQILAQ